MRRDFRCGPARGAFGAVGGGIFFPIVDVIDVFPREPKPVVPRMVLGLQKGQRNAVAGGEGMEKCFSLRRVETEPPEQVGSDAPAEGRVRLLPFRARDALREAEDERRGKSRFTKRARKGHFHGATVTKKPRPVKHWHGMLRLDEIMKRILRKPVSRRGFLKAAAAGAGALALPAILPSRLHGAGGPNQRIRVGQIGCGRIATVHDMPGELKSGLADNFAVCDLDSKRAAAGRVFVESFYQKNNLPAPDISVHGLHEALIARKDIDAVVISLPDHQHAQVALTAIRAGKDVYLQKPMTLTHAEGMLLREAVKKSDRIVQVGSQQRSWGPHEQFRKACEFVRSGRVGNLRQVEIGLPVDPTKPDDPPQTVPPNLNYERWLGPTPDVYYTEQRVHSQSDVTSVPAGCATSLIRSA